MTSNADPVMLELQTDAATGRMVRFRVIETAAGDAPGGIPEDEPHRWHRVLRRWRAKHR